MQENEKKSVDKKKAKSEIDLVNPNVSKKMLGLSTLVCTFALFAAVYLGFESLFEKGDITFFLIGLLVFFFLGPVLLVIFGIWLKGKGYYSLADFVMIITQYLSLPGRLVNFTMWEIGAYTTRIEIYLELGKLEKASELGARVQALANSHIGVPKDDVAMEAAMLYGIVEAKKGNFDKAIRFGNSKLVDAKSVFVKSKTLENAKTLASAFNSMGVILDAAEQFGEARKMYENSLKLRSEYLGEDNALNGYPLANIGYTYLREGKFEEAENHLLKARAKISDSIHQIEGIDSDCKAWLADALLSQGKVSEAETLIDENYRFRLKKQAKNGDKLAYSKVLKGKLYASKDHYKDANRFIGEAISSLESTPGYYKSQLKYAYEACSEVATKSGDQVLLAESQKKAKLVTEEVETKSTAVVIVDENSDDELLGLSTRGEQDSLMVQLQKQRANISVSSGEKAGEQFHPVLEPLIKRSLVIPILFILSIGIYSCYSVVSLDGDINYLYCLFFIAIFGVILYPLFSNKRKLKKLNSLLVNQDPTSAKVSIEQDRLGGLVTRTSGFIESAGTDLKANETERMFFDIYSKIGIIAKFDGSTVDSLLYRDPVDNKLVAIETKNAILVVNRKFTSKFPPILQVVWKLGVFTCIYAAFIAAFTLSYSSDLPDQIPTDLTAQKYFKLGKRFKVAGLTEKSREALLLAKEKGKDSEIAEKADIYIRTKLPRNKVSEEAIKMNIKGYNSQGIFSGGKGENIWKKCIEKYPGFEWPYSNLASSYIKQGKLDEAEALLEKALEINPEYTNALINMAKLQRARKSWGKADSYIDRVLKLEPDNSRAKKLKSAPKF